MILPNLIKHILVTFMEVKLHKKYVIINSKQKFIILLNYVKLKIKHFFNLAKTPP